MTRQELIEFCLTFPAAYEDHPFENFASLENGAWTAMRHHANKKTFAFINELNGRLCVNLKCDPFEADFLRQAFKDVMPERYLDEFCYRLNRRAFRSQQFNRTLFACAVSSNLTYHELTR